MKYLISFGLLNYLIGTLLAMLLLGCGDATLNDELTADGMPSFIATKAKPFRAACIIKDSTALYVASVESNDPAHYRLPGGHIEQGETPSQAAKRETKEETGLKVLTTAFVDSSSTTYYFYCTAKGKAKTQGNDPIVKHLSNLGQFTWE